MLCKNTLLELKFNLYVSKIKYKYSFPCFNIFFKNRCIFSFREFSTILKQKETAKKRGVSFCRRYPIGGKKKYITNHPGEILIQMLGAFNQIILQIRRNIFKLLGIADHPNMQITVSIRIIFCPNHILNRYNVSLRLGHSCAEIFPATEPSGSSLPFLSLSSDRLAQIPEFDDSSIKAINPELFLTGKLPPAIFDPSTLRNSSGSLAPMVRHSQ